MVVAHTFSYNAVLLVKVKGWNPFNITSFIQCNKSIWTYGRTYEIHAA